MVVTTSSSQTKLHSFVESLNAAAFAAPTSIALHKATIVIGNDCVLLSSSCNDLYVGLSWFAFFLHAILWKYIVRRIYDRYHVELNPYSLSKKLLKKMGLLTK